MYCRVLLIDKAGLYISIVPIPKVNAAVTLKYAEIEVIVASRGAV